MQVGKLRYATLRPEDIDAVMEIERRSFASPWSAGLFRHELKVPFSRLVAAWMPEEVGDRLVGYVCRWLVAGEIHILNLAVDPDCRRHGVGRALVGLVLAEAANEGISHVSLEVREENAAGRALYSAMSFVESGRRRNYYGRGEDAIIMTWAGQGEIT